MSQGAHRMQVDIYRGDNSEYGIFVGEQGSRPGSPEFQLFFVSGGAEFDTERNCFSNGGDHFRVAIDYGDPKFMDSITFDVRPGNTTPFHNYEHWKAGRVASFLVKSITFDNSTFTGGGEVKIPANKLGELTSQLWA